MNFVLGASVNPGLLHSIQISLQMSLGQMSLPTEAQEEYILAPFKYMCINKVNSVWINSIQGNTVSFQKTLCFKCKKNKMFLLTFPTDRGNYFRYFILALYESWREQIMGMEKYYSPFPLQCYCFTVCTEHHLIVFFF